jgi:hypothetical protein
MQTFRRFIDQTILRTPLLFSILIKKIKMFHHGIKNGPVEKTNSETKKENKCGYRKEHLVR